MKRSCNCPDYGDPCKHQAALYFIIAREIDADPGLLFRLRGIDLRKLSGPFTAGLDRELPVPFKVEPETPKPAKAKKAAETENSPPEREGPPPSGTPESPWELPELPHCADLILSLLPPSPSFCEDDFTVVLAEFYHKAARFTPWETGSAGENGEPFSWERLFSCSRWTVECPDPRPGAEPVLIRETLSGDTERHSVYDAFTRFRYFSSPDGSESYTFLYYLFKFLGLLCAGGVFIPCPLAEGKSLKIIWLPFNQLPQVNEAFNRIAAWGGTMLPLKKPLPAEKKRPGAQSLKGRPIKDRPLEPKRRGPGRSEVLYAGGRGTADLLASALLNEWVKQNYFDQRAAFRQGGEDFRKLMGLFFRGEGMDISSPALRGMPLAIDRWLAALHTDFSAWKYRFVIKSPAPLKSSQEEIFFDLSMEVLTETPEGLKKTPLKDAAKKTGSIAVLKAPTALSNYLPEIKVLFSRNKTRLSGERLLRFLDEGAALLARLGIETVFPKDLHRELKPRVVLTGTAQKSGALVSYLNLEKLLDWQWQIAIGDEILSPGEFDALLKEKRALVKFRDKFIRLDTAELARLLKTAKTGKPGAGELLKSYFTGDTILSFDAEEIVAGLFAERAFPVPKTLEASLREYQERGYNWICSLLLAGFGCILADDMGLGKTVQSIAVLLRLKEEGLLTEPCLIIAPAALLENWERELARFAPSIKVSRYHGTRRGLSGTEELLLTTYQTAVRDRAKLEEQAFSLLIVDEAHLMKNAETRGAQTVKQLHSRFRLALSGTPVENRLEDLRSLFDFILPGYLGNQAQFKESYRFPIEVMRRRDTAERLRKITAPFLLRRLKTDKAIIADLPEKIVATEYAVLEKEQAALYESVVAACLEKSARLMEGRERAGLILNLLTSLKQICDHPRVYDKESPALGNLSGKSRLLLTLLEEILSGGEKTLVFSQYVETLECLAAIIKNELEEAALIYHGGMGQKKRGEIIDRFQTDPACRILLVSLRAGGLGLNLTAASRVIHYDLWYNPAVENQATDRAFRIGQKRNVFVHRFLTKNSFEEKIDAMLKSKRELADMTVSSGESWLARMSHEELKALFDR
jgi:SNF2 family DNA or RNA helicase